MEGVTVGVGGGRVTTAVGVAPGGAGYGSLVGKVSVMTGVAMGGSSAAASVAVGVGSIGMGVSADGRCDLRVYRGGDVRGRRQGNDEGEQD